MDWKNPFAKSNDASTLEDLANRSLASFVPAAQTDRWRYLIDLPCEQLAETDERLRAWGRRVVFRTWPEGVLPRIAKAKIGSDLRQTLLFIAADHADGRTRQQALWMLPAFPGRLTLAASLIRLSDWVPEVVFAARNAATQLLASCSDDDVIATWPLALRLTIRERFDCDWFGDQMLPWALQGGHAPRLVALMRANAPRVRAWAYHVALETQAPLPFDVAASAFADPDPSIALLPFRMAGGKLDATQLATLAARGRAAHHPIVRRESLRALDAAGKTPPAAELRHALLDRSAGVRSLAAYLLHRDHGEDARPVWRDALDRDVDRPTPGALLGLIHVAEAEDQPRLRRWLADPAPAVRRHALAGLLKAGGTVTTPELKTLISMGGTRVLNLLLESVRRGAIGLDIRRLAQLDRDLRATSAERACLRKLVAELGHWERLGAILHWAPDDQVGRASWRDMCSDWLEVSHNYAPLGRQRQAELLASLEACRMAIPSSASITIRRALEEA